MGIKYCGGCQSRYDRGKVIREIIKDIPELNYEFVEDGQVYDYLLEISGCPVKCADISKYKVNNSVIDINDHNYKSYKEIILEKIKIKDSEKR